MKKEEEKEETFADVKTSGALAYEIEISKEGEVKINCFQSLPNTTAALNYVGDLFEKLLEREAKIKGGKRSMSKHHRDCLRGTVDYMRPLLMAHCEAVYTDEMEKRSKPDITIEKTLPKQP